MFKLRQFRLKILPQLVAIFALIIGIFSPVILANESTKTQLKSPDILLAHIYQRGVDVWQYLVNEKLDGVCAIWYGKLLRRRAGNEIATPIWFTQALQKYRWMANYGKRMGNLMPSQPQFAQLSQIMKLGTRFLSIFMSFPTRLAHLKRAQRT